MKGKEIGLEIENLDKWEAWLASCQKDKVDEMKGRILRTAGLRGLEYAEDLTPVRTGRLKGSMSFGSKDNVFTLKVGKTSYVAYGTAVSYAAAVENGFTQEAGRFVPGFWSNGTFHYVPAEQAKAEGIGGMVLTGKVIAGAHMLQKSLDYLTEDLSKIAEFEFRRLYASLITG